jgi:transposase InsO family protein
VRVRDEYAGFTFGKRLVEAGVLGRMGAVRSGPDNATGESFFVTNLQTDKAMRTICGSL